MTLARIFKNNKYLYTCTLCATPFIHFKGFMFTPQPPQGQGLLFTFPSPQKTYSFHNLFVFFSIDFIVLDTHSRVTAIKRDIHPFTPRIMHVPGTHRVIELPAGSADSLAVGDTLTIKLKNN